MQRWYMGHVRNHLILAGNTDHVTLGLGGKMGVTVTVTVRWSRATPGGIERVLRLLLPGMVWYGMVY